MIKLDLWHLKDINWLGELSSESLDRLCAAATLLEVERGSMIFEPVREPQFVYLLENGLVRIYRTSSNGEEMTLGYVHPGEVFGELAVFSDKPRRSYAVAVEPSTVIKVQRHVFADVIRSRASIVFSVAAQVGGRFKQIESRAEDLVFRGSRSRLASIILQLADEFGSAPADGSPPGTVVVDIRMTQAELATLAGTSRPTVSIALAGLEEEGCIERSDGKIVILDVEALRREADTER